VTKVEQPLSRRSFLRASSLAVGHLSAMARIAPLLASPQEQPGGNRRRPVTRSLSRQFAEWVASLRYQDLPPEVADRAKGITLQTLSSVLIGWNLPAGQEAVRLVTEEEAGVRNGATILVGGTKVTKAGAAFANSEMAQAGGKWDTFRMLTHPAVSIVPAALAAVEVTGASGRDYITGLVAGYEVSERMSADFIPTVMARGFHASPVFGIFGAAVAAAKIMGFTQDQVNNTISLCVNLAGGNLQSRGLREGAAVRNAMLAVALAKQGQRAGDTALEGPAGFYYAYAGNNKGELRYSFVGDNQTSLEKITAGLGKDWIFLETLYRIYSIPGYNIAPIDITAKLCEEHQIRYEDVDRIEVVSNWLETQYPSPAFPTLREDIGEARQGGTRYYTAYGAVKHGYPMLAGTPDPPEVLELMKRVTIIPSHDMTLFGPRITIFTKDGKSYTKQGTGREFIWNFDEEVRRIRPITPGIPLPPDQFEEVIATCRTLDQQARADKLIQTMLKK
jgi:2-methylcitrate dehydratase PrpD